MIKKGYVNLIYIIEGIRPNKSPYEQEIQKLIKCDILSTFSNNYYVTRDRDMRSAITLRVTIHNTFDYEGGQLRYCEFGDKRYVIENILNDTPERKNRFKLIDAQEYKR